MCPAHNPSASARHNQAVVLVGCQFVSHRVVSIHQIRSAIRARQGDGCGVRLVRRVCWRYGYGTGRKLASSYRGTFWKNLSLSRSEQIAKHETRRIRLTLEGVVAHVVQLHAFIALTQTFDGRTRQHVRLAVAQRLRACRLIIIALNWQCESAFDSAPVGIPSQVTVTEA